MMQIVLCVSQGSLILFLIPGQSLKNMNLSQRAETCLFINIHSSLWPSHKQASSCFSSFSLNVRSGQSKETPKCQSSRANNRHLLWAPPRFLARRTAELNEWGSPACGFVQRACQALLFQPLSLCQTVNVLMLIQVSGSAGRCQGEWEAVNKEMTYIHRVIAAVCQVAFEKMSSWKEGSRGEKKKEEGGSKQHGGRAFFIFINCFKIFYLPFFCLELNTRSSRHRSRNKQAVVSYFWKP